jgi:hypothetical protein
MLKTTRQLTGGVAIALLMAAPVAADDISSAATDLCEKVKACSMAQIEKEDLTPEVRQMMEPMLENLCASMRGGVKEVPAGHELYQPAVECMRSMANLSCEEFQDSAKVETPQCVKYREMAEAAYGDS